jgi:WD40 repeat protein
LPEGRAVKLSDALQLYTTQLEISPDGKLLATPGPKDLTVWDLEKGEVRWKLDGHKNYIYAIAFSPDSKLLASAGGSDGYPGGGDVAIRLWDMGKGKLIAALEGHRATVQSLAFSPDGKKLASAGRDHSIRLWDVAKGEAVRTFDGGGSLVAFSPDGKKLVVGRGGGVETIQFLDPDTGEKLQEITDCALYVRCVCFSPDGKKLATVNDSRAIRLWDAETGKEIPTNSGHRDQVLSVVYSPDGKTLASRSSDSTIRLWDAVAGRQRHTLRFGNAEGGGPRWRGEGDYSLAFSPDGKTLAGLGGSLRTRDRVFHVWDVRSGEILADCEQQWYPTSVAFSPDGETLAVGAYDGLHLWSSSSYKQLKVIDAPGEEQRPGVGACAAFTPDGRTVAVSCPSDSVIRLRDAATGDLVREIPVGREISVGKEFFCCLTFSPDGSLLAACNPRVVHVWETATGELVRKCGEQYKSKDSHKASATCVAFAPDGRRLVVAAGDFIDVYDVLTGELLSGSHDRPLLKGHRGAALCVAWSPDGKTIASGGDDTTILVWDAADLLPKAPAADIGDKERDRLWGDLQAKDPAEAYKALLGLLGAPDTATALIKDRVPPAPKLDAKRVKSLLTDLDSGESDVREAASRELGKLGEAVEPDLRAALAGEPSEEVKARCKVLLDALKHDKLDPEGLRQVRAVQVLERLGTPEARAVLKDLAGGAPGRLSRDARLALDRLDKRAP